MQGSMSSEVEVSELPREARKSIMRKVTRKNKRRKLRAVFDKEFEASKIPTDNMIRRRFFEHQPKLLGES